MNTTQANPFRSTSLPLPEELESAIAAIDFVKQKGAQTISLLALISAPEGIEALHQAHPEVHVISAAIDEKLIQVGYIMPGLGDAGDRIFGS